VVVVEPSAALAEQEAVGLGRKVAVVAEVARVVA
jgi:hypothetical protein